jgi:hypothetical protein
MELDGLSDLSALEFGADELEPIPEPSSMSRDHNGRAADTVGSVLLETQQWDTWLE